MQLGFRWDTCSVMERPASKKLPPGLTWQSPL